jgi:hypothetical protein
MVETMTQEQVRALLAKGKRKRAPAPAISPGWVVTLELPFVTASEANRRDHWAVRNRRKKDQQAALGAVFAASGLWNWKPPLPVRVTLTRQGSRLLDPDNLAGSFKHVQDGVARLVLGVDDGDRARVEWVYDQCPGVAGVFVRIEPGRA